MVSVSSVLPRFLSALCISVSVSLLGVGPARAQSDDVPRFDLEVEAGPAWFSRNNVRIPSDSGDRFSMRDLTGAGPETSVRLYGTWHINDRHAPRLTLAPLSTRGSGFLDSPVRFQQSDFDTDSPVAGRYQFSTYRLGYRWTFHRSERWQWGVGATALVRDAEIRLRQGQVQDKDDDLGFVPLLHLYGRYQFTPELALVMDLEGAAAPQGRAVDAALKLEYSLPSGWYVNGGYRTLEGGADNDSLYTFAWIHYAVLGAGIRF